MISRDMTLLFHCSRNEDYSTGPHKPSNVEVTESRKKKRKKEHNPQCRDLADYKREY